MNIFLPICNPPHPSRRGVNRQPVPQGPLSPIPMPAPGTPLFSPVPGLPSAPAHARDSPAVPLVGAGLSGGCRSLLPSAGAGWEAAVVLRALGPPGAEEEEEGVARSGALPGARPGSVRSPVRYRGPMVRDGASSRSDGARGRGGFAHGGGPARPPIPVSSRRQGWRVPSDAGTAAGCGPAAGRSLAGIDGTRTRRRSQAGPLGSWSLPGAAPALCPGGRRRMRGALDRDILVLFGVH